jgi:WD40 repeat protein
MLRRNLDRLLPRPRSWAARTGAVLAAACLAVTSAGALLLAADGPGAGAASSGTPGRATTDAHGDSLPVGALARLGTTRLRHQGDVTFVGFGAHGKTLVTAGRDNTVRLWDLATGKEVRRFARPSPAAPQKKKASGEGKPAPKAPPFLMGRGLDRGGSLPVALAPDGKTLAVGGSTVIRLWEVQTGKEFRTIPGAPDGLAGLLFSPDGRTLAGRAPGGSLFLWEADTGRLLHQIKPPPRKGGGPILLTFGGGGADAPGMAFTPDGKALAAAGTDLQDGQTRSSVTFWDTATGKEIRKLPAPRDVRVSAVAIAPAGKALAYGGGGVVHLCEADTGKEVRRLPAPDGGILALAFSPNGKVLAARGKDQKVRLWETVTGKELHQLGDAETPPRTGGLVFVTDLFTGPEMRVLAISPDGKQVASAAGPTVRIWETATGKELPLLGGHRRAPSAAALSPDGKAVVSWGADRVVRRWDARGRPLGAFPAPPRTTLAAFSPDGATAALANADGTIRLHETATGKELRRLEKQPGEVVALAFSPDGKAVAVRRGDTAIRLHDVARGAELRQIALRPAAPPANVGVIVLGGRAGGARGPGPGLAFSPDGKLLITPRPGAAGNALVLFDATTGKELRKIESPQRIVSFAFSPDGRALATENADRTVTLWEVASGRERGRLGKAVAGGLRADAAMGGVMVVVNGLPNMGGEPPGSVGLAFSPDGRALATRAPDHSVRVWDLTAGKEVRTFAGHAGRVETVAFSPDGKVLASGAADTTLLLWDAAGLGKDLQALPPAELSAAEVKAIWGELAGADAARALRGVLKLAASPRQALPVLREHLKPTVPIDPQKIAGWIADLESKKFAVREGASANLLAVGEQAVPALQKLCASPPSLETRSRAEALLGRITGGALTAEQLRLIRAVEALERMGALEARRLLQALAQGVPGTLTTREAQAALGRLDRLPGPRP